MSSPLTSFDEAATQARLERFPSATPLGGWVAPLFEEAAAVQQSVAKGDWSNVLTQSARCLGFGYAVLRWLEAEMIASRRRIEFQQQSHQLFVDVLKAIAQSKKGEAFFTRLGEGIKPRNPDDLLDAAIQALREKLADRNLPDKVFSQLRKQLKKNQSDPPQLSKSLKMLAEGKTKGVPLLSALDAIRGESPQRVVFEAAIACLSRGLMAWVHAEFNLAFQRAQKEAEALTQKDTAEVITKMVDDFAAELRSGQLALYGALAAGRSSSEVIALSFALAGNMETRLPAFAHIQAKLDVLTRRLRGEGKGSASEELGSLAIRAGALTREALATHAASYRLAAELSSGSPHPDVIELQEKATSIPFEATLPVAKKTALGKVGSLKDKASVEIEGFVQSLVAGRSADKKLITQIELLDPSSRKRAQAVAVFVNLPHMGVTVDAYCRLQGVFRKQSKVLKNKPVVEVDRLSVSELKAQSWWVGFIELSNLWFPYWRNNTNMYWSLGPHESVEKGETSRQGAAEIIFLPIIQTKEGK